MSETIDHNTGRPIDAGVVAIGVGALGAAAHLLNQVAQHKEMLGSAGSVVVGAVTSNPKVVLGVAAAVGAGYCIYRLTQSGTNFEFGKLKYSRK
ncbi:hypothetical protein PFAS1_23195 [Pseudomonas frederiksbergensis]|uniref:hypothetical protein n=1 Tax=Pseudomonas frederiksbergensis TaxID=104087 RepID=UPI000958199C|nr:hypothetical protein [Pseudomonas frederiksbergensis]APV42088.1 hypothetical protein PFAS1_23195 [Pseudomonas frederiksbergensis]